MMNLGKQGLSALAGAFFVLMPRAAPGVLAAAGVYCCARLPPSRSEVRHLWWWAVVISAYPALSALWAADARRALWVVLGSALVTAVSIFVYRRTGRLKDVFLPALTYGIPAIIFISLIDVLFGLPLRAALVDLGISWIGQPRMVKAASHEFSASAINWSLTILVVLLLPYLEATRREAKNDGQTRMRIAVLITAVVTVFLSPHESSMLAVCVGGFIYAVSTWSKPVALGIVAAGWMVSIAGTPLLMRAVTSMPHSIVQTLPASLQHRFLIWRYSVNEIAQHPWLGAGAGSTRVAFREARALTKSATNRGVAPHSHNWFLDIWRELGAVGAAMAIMLVATVTYRMYLRLHEIAPERIAFAGLVLSMSTASFGLWAMWYLSAIGMAFALFGLSREEAQPDEPAAIA